MTCIRRMGLDDLSQVELIEALNFSLPRSRDLYESALALPYAHLNVASLPFPSPLVGEGQGRGGEIIGYIEFWIYAAESHLQVLSVHPDWQGKGVGRALMADLFTQAAENGVCSVYAEVRASNERARRFYRALGFQETGSRKRYYPDNQEDAILLYFSS